MSTQEPTLADHDLRITQLEESVAALAREVEELREDLRALAAVVREGPPVT